MSRFRTLLPATSNALLFTLLIALYLGLIRSPGFVPFLPPEIQIMIIFVLSTLFMVVPSANLSLVASRLPVLAQYKLLLFPFFLGLLSLFSVFFWFLSKDLGTVFSAILLATQPLGISALRTAKTDQGFWHPIAIQVLVSITFAVSAFDRGWSLDGLRLIAHRYWVSIDSALPFIFARHLVSDRAALLNNFGGGGQGNSADRPPLMAGAALHLQGFASTFWEVTVFLSVAFIANSVWIIGLWQVLRGFRVSENRILWNVLLVALSGMTFVNTVYTWPKLLGAGFSLCALSLAMGPKPRNIWAHGLFGSFLALAMLSHGSTVFFLVPISVLLFSRFGRPSLQQTSALGLSAAILYAPWVIYQNLIDPPGDRLLKWHLAGVIPESNEPFIQALFRRYGDLDPFQLAQNKVNNFLALLGFSPDTLSMASSQPMWTDFSLSGLRHIQSISLLPALGLSLFPLVKYLFIQHSKKSKEIDSLLWLGLLSTCFYAVMEFGNPDMATAWFHTSPHATYIIFLACANLIVANMGRRYAFWYSIASLIFFFTIWIASVSKESAFQNGPVFDFNIYFSIASVSGFMLIVRLLLRNVPVRSEVHVRG